MMDIRLLDCRPLLAATVLLVSVGLSAVQMPAQSRFEGEGRVVAVDEDQGVVTLDHGPIPGLMPAMVMAFSVQRPDLLRAVQVGDVVRFSLQPRGTAWVIASFEQIRERQAPRAALFPAPDFTLPMLSGATLSLSDLRGRVILVNFWATWCVPCRTEMPSIEALYQRYKQRGFDVVAVNLDMLSTAGVEGFVKEVAVTFAIVLDPSWATARTYQVRGVPTTYLIDRAGKVVVREMGGRDWMDSVSQAAVEGLLSEPGPGIER